MVMNYDKIDCKLLPELMMVHLLDQIMAEFLKVVQRYNSEV